MAAHWVSYGVAVEEPPAAGIAGWFGSRLADAGTASVSMSPNWRCASARDMPSATRSPTTDRPARR